MSQDSPLAEADQRADIVDILDSGFDKANALKVGSGFMDLTGGISGQMAFGRAEIGRHLTDAVTAFGFAQVSDSFKTADLQFEAGAGIRVLW